jgi:hypothetical protein
MSHQEYTVKIVGDFGKNPPEITSVKFVQAPPVTPPPVTPPPPAAAGVVFNRLASIHESAVWGLNKFADQIIAEKAATGAILDRNEQSQAALRIAAKETVVATKLNAFKGKCEIARNADRTGVNPQVGPAILAGQELVNHFGTPPPVTIGTPPSPSRADWADLFEKIKSLDLTAALMAARDRWDRTNPH